MFFKSNPIRSLADDSRGAAIVELSLSLVLMFGLLFGFFDAFRGFYTKVGMRFIVQEALKDTRLSAVCARSEDRYKSDPTSLCSEANWETTNNQRKENAINKIKARMRAFGMSSAAEEYAGLVDVTLNDNVPVSDGDARYYVNVKIVKKIVVTPATGVILSIFGKYDGVLEVQSEATGISMDA